tara:strand:- start:117 stop:422 length:306 start_codon:yes stop_codon:yes gene_type:complete
MGALLHNDLKALGVTLDVLGTTASTAEAAQQVLVTGVGSGKPDLINRVVMIENEPVRTLRNLGLGRLNVRARGKVLRAHPMEELPGILATTAVVAYPFIES